MNLEEQQMEIEIDPEQGSLVDVDTLGNYFDNQRQNYFELKRTLWVVGEIDWNIAIGVIQRLNVYVAQYKEDKTMNDPIYIYLSSPGGECDAGFAIIDAMEKVKKCGIEIYTICAGSCSSMASVILASGSVGKRFAFPSSRIMIHQAGVSLTGGRLPDINIVQKELEFWTDNMNKIYKKQTGKSMDELKTLTSFDNYMSANEAKKLGLVDKIDAKLV